MKVCSFASGSKGNCTYLETENTKILLDLGVNLKYVLFCLEKFKVEPTEIDAIIITHEHSDHIKGVEMFAKKFNTKIYCPLPLYNLICSQMPNLINQIITIKSSFNIGDFTIYPFELSHDSFACFGYRIADDTGSASFITDTGILPDRAFEMAKGSSLIFLESNYDPDMLMACTYPFFLKKRIMGQQGHLSNLDSAKLMLKFQKTGTRVIALSHISENSNTPSLAYNVAKNYLEANNIILGEHLRLGINYQGQINSVYKLSKKI